MRTILPVVLFLAMFGLLACGGEPATDAVHSPDSTDARAANETAALPEKVSIAATIAKAIEANPEQAEEILARHQMTEDSFEELMYEIAADPQLTRAYESALGG